MSLANDRLASLCNGSFGSIHSKMPSRLTNNLALTMMLCSLDYIKMKLGEGPGQSRVNRYVNRRFPSTLLDTSPPPRSCATLAPYLC